jgi:hypothetical protein
MIDPKQTGKVDHGLVCFRGGYHVAEPRVDSKSIRRVGISLSAINRRYAIKCFILAYLKVSSTVKLGK